MIASIPVSFEFRKTKVEWEQTVAHFTGWARHKDGSEDGSYLLAEFTTGGMSHQIRFSRRRLPEQWDNLWMQAYSDRDVEQTFSEYKPLLVLPRGKIFIDEELKKNSQPADAWQLREEFLKLDDTPESAVGFLNQWGRWNSEPFVELSEISHLQQAVREAVINSRDGWFASEYALPSTWKRCSEFPYFSMLTDKVEAAVRMTVTVDLLGKAEFKTCARPDCGQPFKVESSHERKFCSRSCGHVEAMRRRRKAANRTTDK